MEDNKTEGGDQANSTLPGSVITPNTSITPPIQQPVEDNNNAISPSDIREENFNIPPARVDNPVDQLVSNKDGLTWRGPEFISHDKSSRWYMLCAVVAIILGAVTYLATSKDLVSSLTITIATVVLGFYSLRKPKQITYNLSDNGISIGNKNFSYGELKTFTATIEGDYLNINLFPMKRFGPPIGLCYRGNGEEEIVGFLSDRLPIEKHKPDILERILIMIRF